MELDFVYSRYTNYFFKWLEPFNISVGSTRPTQDQQKTKQINKLLLMAENRLVWRQCRVSLVTHQWNRWKSLMNSKISQRGEKKQATERGLIPLWRTHCSGKDIERKWETLLWEQKRNEWIQFPQGYFPFLQIKGSNNKAPMIPPAILFTVTYSLVGS